MYNILHSPAGGENTFFVVVLLNAFSVIGTNVSNGAIWTPADLIQLFSRTFRTDEMHPLSCTTYRIPSKSCASSAVHQFALANIVFSFLWTHLPFLHAITLRHSRKTSYIDLTLTQKLNKLLWTNVRGKTNIIITLAVFFHWFQYDSDYSRFVRPLLRSKRKPQQMCRHRLTNKIWKMLFLHFSWFQM